MIQVARMRDEFDELAKRQLRFAFDVAEREASTNWPFGALERGAYGAIAADPPWTFATWSERGQRKSASQHYAVMSLDAIKALPVADLATPDCLLLLWATQAQLDQALDVMRRWGFAFKSVGAWAKQSRSGASWAFGTGYWLRSAAEFFLVGTRGHPKTESRSERNLIVAPGARAQPQAGPGLRNA
jgi:N6-adenosine-specific RNA methylase IME4